MANTTVGSLLSTGSSGSGTTYTGPSITTQNVGDLVTVATFTQATTLTITQMVFKTSGGTTLATMAPSGSAFVSSASGATGTLELWRGTVVAVGTGTPVITWSGTNTSYIEVDALMFSSGLGASTVWTVDGTAGGIQKTTASTTVQYPSITPTAAGRVYFGKSVVSAGTPSAGATSGYSYGNDASSDQACWNPSCTASAQAPTGGLSASGTNAAYAAMFKSALPAAASPPPGPLLIARAVIRAATR